MSMPPDLSAKNFTQVVAMEIRVAMTRADVRQSDLARRIGKTEQWLSVRLRGKQAIDLNDLALIAQGLEVNPLDLLPSREITAAAAANPKVVSGQLSRLVTPAHAGLPVRRGNRPSGRNSAQRRPVSVRVPGHTMPSSYAA
jgi:transcriptional regulator with XRE-family HTH domain